MTVSGLTMWTAVRHPDHACETQAPQHPVGRREANTRLPRSIHDGQLVSERDDLQVH